MFHSTTTGRLELKTWICPYIDIHREVDCWQNTSFKQKPKAKNGRSKIARQLPSPPSQASPIHAPEKNFQTQQNFISSNKAQDRCGSREGQPEGATCKLLH